MTLPALWVWLYWNKYGKNKVVKIKKLFSCLPTEGRDTKCFRKGCELTVKLPLLDYFWNWWLNYLIYKMFENCNKCASQSVKLLDVCDQQFKTKTDLLYNDVTSTSKLPANVWHFYLTHDEWQLIKLHFWLFWNYSIKLILSPWDGTMLKREKKKETHSSCHRFNVRMWPKLWWWFHFEPV